MLIVTCRASIRYALLLASKPFCLDDRQEQGVPQAQALALSDILEGLRKNIKESIEAISEKVIERKSRRHRGLRSFLTPFIPADTKII